MALSLLSATIPTPPAAPTAEDQKRWDHSSLRIRLLLGRWKEDLERAIALHIDPTRQAAWGIPDLSSNVFRSVTKQMSCLYDRPPLMDNADAPEDAAELAGAIEKAGLWPLMSRVSVFAIGCREYAVRVHATADGELQYRPIAPDHLICAADPDRPDRPVYVKELRLRQHPVTGKRQWCWDVLDISDPSNPSERIMLADHRGKDVDVTLDYLGETRTGEAYPYRDSTGKPFLPLTLIHAEKTGRLWDSFEGSELIYGSLSAAVLMSFFVHTVRDASWPQRYAVGAVPAGLEHTGSGKDAHRSVATDPGSILMFTSDGNELQPQLGQFTAGADVSKLMEAVSLFENRVSEFAGISPSNLTRNHGTPKSGYAVTVTQAGKREAQDKFMPTFRVVTVELLRISACMLNRATGSTLPETGYTVRFQSVPLSPQERDSIRRDVLEKIELGLMSKVDAYMVMNPGITRPRALQELQRIKLEESVTVPMSGAAGTPADAGAIIGDEPTIDEDGNIQDAGERVILNGAQVTAAQGIVTAVAVGDLPRDSGLSMLVEFFGIPVASANRIMGTVGLGFLASSATPKP